MTKIQFRRGTAAEWNAANRVLAMGELGYETDTGKFKIGDGARSWNGPGRDGIDKLPYASSGAFNPTQYALTFGDTLTGTASSFNGSAPVTLNVGTSLPLTTAGKATALANSPYVNGRQWDGSANTVIAGAIYGTAGTGNGTFRNIYVSAAASAPVGNTDRPLANGDVWIAY